MILYQMLLKLKYTFIYSIQQSIQLYKMTKEKKNTSHLDLAKDYNLLYSDIGAALRTTYRQVYCGRYNRSNAHCAGKFVDNLKLRDSNKEDEAAVPQIIKDK